MSRNSPASRNAGAFRKASAARRHSARGSASWVLGRRSAAVAHLAPPASPLLAWAPPLWTPPASAASWEVCPTAAVRIAQATTLRAIKGWGEGGSHCVGAPGCTACPEVCKDQGIHLIPPIGGPLNGPSGVKR